MTSIIKNQIIKHLSKFVKNLSQDKIGLSTLKGEGQLTNLELDEEVLMEVLELPSWIRITRVVCNRLSVKIPWTKLKTHPICLYLDQVELEMETCRDLRKTASESKQAAQSVPSKYGFPERVVDGMFVHVNSITGKFKSDTFHADIQLAQLVVQSTTPDWKQADLRYSRIKDMNRGQVLTFKAVEWSTFRLTVDAIEKGSGSPTTPIRLITNQGRIQITIKKRLNDCSLVTSRLQVLLDDILWVLTDSQIKAVILHMRSLNPVIQKAAAQSKVHAEAAGEATSQLQPTEDPTARPHNVKTSKELQLLQFFERYDVQETSYHFFTKRVDLHLCDEMNRPESESVKRRIEGGAMQISFTGLSLDFYPYHIASSSRLRWEFYDDAMSLSDKWIHTILAHFKQQYAMARSELKKRATSQASSQATTPTQVPPPKQASPPSQATPPARPATPPNAKRHSVSGPPRERSSSASQGRPPPRPGAGPGQGSARGGPVPQPARTSVKLMSSCLVFRIRGLQLSNVATSDRGANNEENLRNNMFLISDKKTFHLPPEIPSVHVEYMSFYFPNELDFPVPAPVIYTQINPMQLRLDNTTLLWLNQFAFNIMQSLPEIDEIAPADQTNQGQDHVDIRVDALMQKILVPVPDPVPNQPDRPKVLQIQVSQVTATNCRVGTQSTRPDLSKVLQKLQGVPLFNSQSSFPSSPSDLESLPAKFWTYAYEPNFIVPSETREGAEGLDRKRQENGTPPQLGGVGGIADPREASPRLQSQLPPAEVKLTTYSFRPSAAEDVWGIKVDQFWMDFVGVPSSPDRPVPFIQPLPLQLWMCSVVSGSAPKSRDPVETSSLANMHLVVDTPSFVDLTINHYQLLFLLRLQQSLQTLTANLELDQYLYVKEEEEEALPVSSRIISLVFPSIRLTLLGPPSSEEEEEVEEAKVPEKEEIEEEAPRADTENTRDAGKTEVVGQEREADSGKRPEGGVCEEEARLFKVDACGKVESSSSSPLSDSTDGDGSVQDKLCNSAERGGGVQTERSSLRGMKLGGPPGAVVITEATPNGVVSSRAHQPSGVEIRAGRGQGHTEAPPPRKNNSASDLTQSGSVSSETSSGSMSNLPLGIPKSSSQNSITMQMSALMSSSSMASLDEQGLDFETMSVSSDSSEGFTMISTHSSRIGSTTDLESESGLGSEFSQPVSVNGGAPEVPSAVTPSAQPDIPDSTGGQDVPKGQEVDAKPKSDSFDGCIHKLRKVSVLNLDLAGVNAVVQMRDKDLVLKAAVRTIHKTESGNEDFTKYMNKLDSDHSSMTSCLNRAFIQERLMLLSCSKEAVRLYYIPMSRIHGDFHRENVKKKKGQEGETKTTPDLSKAMLRFMSGPCADAQCEGAADRGHIQLQLNDIDLNFLKSSLTNISSLMQDELDSEPLPLDITVFNTALTLQDDSPLVYPDTVPAPPLQLRIPSVRVQRTLDGTFHVKGIHPDGISLKPTGDVIATTSASRVVLDQTPANRDALPDPASVAMAAVQDENASLRKRMGLMKDALAVLERERTSLLSTLEHLQEELLTADRERDKLKEDIVELSRRVNLGR
ncbi:bridge-like lipid transfer protein family member 3B [Diadema setosum]|uniref:bridge-like lipid transfer protein family member 3B n=1 Tax=Diadema setosum TaxID=31175 RepID=UPI003B3AF559